jgi:thymidine kinase
MIATTQETVRGVVCRHCGKPIRLSATILRREAELNRAQKGSEEVLLLQTRVFPARCRACHEEHIYVLEEIQEFPRQ